MARMMKKHKSLLDLTFSILIVWILVIFHESSSTANAFIYPHQSKNLNQIKTKHKQPHNGQYQIYDSNQLPNHCLQLKAAPSTSMLLADAATTETLTTSMMKYAMETLISNGIPALLTIIVIAFTASQFRDNSKKRDDKGNDIIGFDSDSLKNPAADLYRDLYASDEDDENKSNMSPFKLLKSLGGEQDSEKMNNKFKNRGTPSKKYITIKNLNERYDSYEYSIQAATQSKAKAASNLRAKNFDRAIQLALQQGINADVGSSHSSSAATTSLPPNAKSALLQMEKDFLQKGSRLVQEIQSTQTRVTKKAIDEEMELLGIKPFQLDPPSSVDTNSTGKNSTTIGAEKKKKDDKKSKNNTPMTAELKKLNKFQQELMELELDFIRDIVAVLGSERATGIRMALLGDISARGSGGLLTQLQERPLTSILKSIDVIVEADAEGVTTSTGTANLINGYNGKNLYVTKFIGDVQASQVNELREEVTAIIRNARPNVDEALVILQTGGGTVTGYGLAAAQLLRFKENNIKLTIAVEQVAASGGYMMCCVADKIIGSPFAIFGSIGVISEIPNVYERLKQEGIEFQTVTAGKFKRTITPTKKVTKEDFAKAKEDVEEILVLFRDFVQQNRPELNVEEVATGETWFGTAAVEKNLCDEIKAVDDVINEYVDNGYGVYEVQYTPPIEFDPQKSLSPFGYAGKVTDGNNLVGKCIKWLVQTVAKEIREEFSSDSSWGYGGGESIEKRYIMKDDRSDRTRSEG